MNVAKKRPKTKKIKYKTMTAEGQKNIGEFEMMKKKENKDFVCTNHLLIGKGECPYCKEKKRKVSGGF